MTANLPTTGERFLPDVMAGEIAIEHLHRYHIASKLAVGRDALDLASGEGYGTALIASVARSAVGVDIDGLAVEFATKKYVKSPSNLRFAAGSCTALPLADASFDLVVSFETIEHHAQHEQMLAEIKRVLRPGGLLVISSPDRREYTDVTGYSNPFHVKELYRADFESLLSRWFRTIKLYGQRTRYASTLFPLEPSTRHLSAANFVVNGNEIVESAAAIAPRYLIAVASDNPDLPDLPSGTFASLADEERIAKQPAELESARANAERLLQQMSIVRSRHDGAVDEAARVRGEFREWRKHARALEERAEGQERALRALSEHHGIALKKAHDAGREQGAAEANVELAKLQAEVNRRDAEFSAELNRRDAEFRAELNRRNAEFRAELERRDAGFHVELDRREAEFEAGLEEQRVDFQAEFERQRIENQAMLDQRDVDLRRVLNQRDVEFHAVLHQHEAELQALLRSTSWRFTRPLRAAGRIAAKVMGRPPKAERNDNWVPRESDAIEGLDERYSVRQGLTEAGIDQGQQAPALIGGRTQDDGKAEVDVKTQDDGKAETDVETRDDSKAEVDGKTQEDGKAEVGGKTQGGAKAEIDGKTQNDGKAEADGKAEVETKTDGDTATDPEAAATGEIEQEAGTEPVPRVDDIPMPRQLQIVEEFDESFYLNRYPDVAESGMKPYEHFVAFGRLEGRLGRPPKPKLRQTTRLQKQVEKTVLVVIHEATRTEAPILAWNVCRELSARHQVVVLLLGDDALTYAFDDVCDAVAGPYPPADRIGSAVDSVIGELCQSYELDFAVVNGISARSVLQPLSERCIPSILWIDEFFKVDCSPDELVDALAWAGQTVFPAEIVRERADFERTHLSVALAYVRPQGRSIIPADLEGEARKRSGPASVAQVERMIISGRTNKRFVVLGAGAIEYRNGVDLFVAVADQIRRIAPDAEIAFIWVGRVAEQHRLYADFVAVQIDQAGLVERVQLIEETADLQPLYRLADVCFLSSRLDSIPNIALDAMAEGLPVLSFDRATGIAENLRGDVVLEQCVLPFLNVDEAARRILTLYREPSRRQTLSQRISALADMRFDMSQYVAALIEFSRSGHAFAERVQKGIQRLLAGNEFAEWFFLPPGSGKTREQAVREYVKFAQSGIYLRKPAPGFCPYLYAANHDLGEDRADPFVLFLEDGCPAGAWQEPLLDVSKACMPLDVSMRVALHIHVGRTDLLQDLLQRLSSNRLEAELLISAPSQAIADECRNLLACYKYGSIVVRAVPNGGRDIGSLVTHFREALQQYDVVGYFDTGDSADVVAGPRAPVQDWFNYLMETLLGGQHRTAQSIISSFAADPKLGLVFAEDPYLIGWDSTLPFAKTLAEKLLISSLPEQFFAFPVGAMFWARPAALEPLFDLALAWEDCMGEHIATDRSMLDALMRLLPSIVERAGYSKRLTYVPGVSR